MISFIVIGRNEEWILPVCIKSIKNALSRNSILDYEIIYIDSNSNDQSVKIVKDFKDVSVYVLEGEINAAVARNVGAQKAKGDILFFIDADMEINSDFLSLIIENEARFSNTCLTGHLDDICYSHNRQLIGKYPRTYSIEVPSSEHSLLINGGIFVINAKLWHYVGGMKTKFKRCQDIDFTLRLTRNKIETIRLPHLIASHHMVHYNNERRMIEMVKNGYSKYEAILLRDHFFNWRFLLYNFRNQYSMCVLFFSLIIVLFNVFLFKLSVILFLSLVLFKSIINTSKAKTSVNKITFFFTRFFYQLIKDIVFVWSFVFFYPQDCIYKVQKR